MRLFMFLQRRWTRRTDWRRMTERRRSPLHHHRLPLNPLPQSTPVKVRNMQLYEGRAGWRPDSRRWALSVHSFVLIRGWNMHVDLVKCAQRRSQRRLLQIDMFFQNSPFPWKVIVLEMSNTSSEMLSRVSVFSASATHSCEFPILLFVQNDILFLLFGLHDTRVEVYQTVGQK